jgi:hypothetical protein
VVKSTSSIFVVNCNFPNNFLNDAQSFFTEKKYSNFQLFVYFYPKYWAGVCSSHGPGQRELPAQGDPGGGKGMCILLFDPLQALVSVGIDARAEVHTQLERAVQKPFSNGRIEFPFPSPRSDRLLDLEMPGDLRMAGQRLQWPT